MCMTNHISTDQTVHLGRRTDEAYRAVPYGEYKSPEREAHRVHTDEVMAEFKERLRQEYGTDYSDEVHEEVYRRAWAEGHSEGFMRVVDEYDELTTFVDFIRSH